MTTRQITEYQTFVLCLADMRGKSDNAQPVAVFDSLEALKKFYDSELAEGPWEDEPSADTYGRTHGYTKVFKKGSPLEWYNPLSPVNQREYDLFAVVSWHDALFGGVTENWSKEYPSEGAFTVPFNPRLQ